MLFSLVEKNDINYNFQFKKDRINSILVNSVNAYFIQNAYINTGSDSG